MASKKIQELSKKLDKIISEVIKNEPTLTTSKPDKFLTKYMIMVDAIGQEVMALPSSDKSMRISQRALAVISALRERREYKYMLWSEYTLEACMEGEYADLNKLSMNERIKLYEWLVDVNTRLIPENMLVREVLTRLTEIYDSLDAESKKAVRIRSIQKQSGPLPITVKVKPRKALDDF